MHINRVSKNDVFFHFFQLTLATAASEILKIFDVRDCCYRPSLYSSKVYWKNELLEVEGARAPMPHSWRRQCSVLLYVTDWSFNLVLFSMPTESVGRFDCLTTSTKAQFPSIVV